MKYIVTIIADNNMCPTLDDLVLIVKAKNDKDLENKMKEIIPKEEWRYYNGFSYDTLRTFIKDGILIGNWVGSEFIEEK